MNRSSKRLANLSPAEKRSLLATLLQKKASEATWSVDELGIPVTDLQPEAVLDPAIDVKGPPVQMATAPEHILLTGATGFLGAF